MNLLLVDDEELQLVRLENAVRKALPEAAKILCCANPDRVTIPIEDPDAKTTYYIACLNSEKKKYGAVFSAAREAVLRGM